jgi:hypothetical protein
MIACGFPSEPVVVGRDADGEAPPVGEDTGVEAADTCCGEIFQTVKPNRLVTMSAVSPQEMPLNRRGDRVNFSNRFINLP